VRALALVLLVAVAGLVAVPASSATPMSEAWTRYVPAKERKRAFERATKRDIVKLSAIAGNPVDTTWVTSSVAAAIVSQRVDDERLDAVAAESRFAELRPADSFVVFVAVPANATSPELQANALFMQRSDDRGVFSRGQLKAEADTVQAGAFIPRASHWYSVSFPKTSESGAAIVRSLDDRIEISLKTQYKKPSVTTYSPRELVKTLDEF
jgi:hypothetical protein